MLVSPKLLDRMHITFETYQKVISGDSKQTITRFFANQGQAHFEGGRSS